MMIRIRWLAPLNSAIIFFERSEREDFSEEVAAPGAATVYLFFSREGNGQPPEEAAAADADTGYLLKETTASEEAVVLAPSGVTYSCFLARKIGNFSKDAARA